jgi:hypothetical protein
MLTSGGSIAACEEVTSMPKTKTFESGDLSRLELLRIAPLKECARLAGVSEDSLKRNHPTLIRKIGPRRLGMRIQDVLRLGEKEDA